MSGFEVSAIVVYRRLARNLQQMHLFYRAWPEIPQTVYAEWGAAFPLPWSAYVRLLSVRSEQAREFYEAEACSFAAP